jgi:CheY-like chemotaxis protein
MSEYTATSIRVADESGYKQTRDSSEGQDFTNEGPERPKVLVVDDEKLIADTTAAVLRGAGFEAQAAYDGWAALEMIGQFRPRCLLTDVMMPRMNGVDLAIAVRKMLPRVKIILFSGQAGITEILQSARKEGYEFDLIAKPLHPVKLIDHIKQVTRRYPGAK